MLITVWVTNMLNRDGKIQHVPRIANLLLPLCGARFTMQDTKNSDSQPQPTVISELTVDICRFYIRSVKQTFGVYSFIHSFVYIYMHMCTCIYIYTYIYICLCAYI